MYPVSAPPAAVRVSKAAVIICAKTKSTPMPSTPTKAAPTLKLAFAWVTLVSFAMFFCFYAYVPREKRAKSHEKSTNKSGTMSLSKAMLSKFDGESTTSIAVMT